MIGDASSGLVVAFVVAVAVQSYAVDVAVLLVCCVGWAMDC